MKVYIVTITFNDPDGTATYCNAFGTMKEAQKFMTDEYLKFQEEYKDTPEFDTNFSDTRCFVEHQDGCIDLEIHKREFQVTVRL